MTDEFKQLVSEMLFCAKEDAEGKFLSTSREVQHDIEATAEFLEIKQWRTE